MQSKGKIKLLLAAGAALIAISAVNILIITSSTTGSANKESRIIRRCRPLPLYCEKRLTRSLLDHSLALGTRFMIRNQRPEGNFNYEFDWVEKKVNRKDNQVRQAGALWGLALIYRDTGQKRVLISVKKGLEFFKKQTRESADGRMWVVYPGERGGQTGTLALVCLALTETLMSLDNEDQFRKECYRLLSGYMKALMSMRMRNGHFHRSYSHEECTPFGPHSSYFDGESLLAMVRAAKYAGREDLKKAVLESAEVMRRVYAVEELQSDPDSKRTKGFYQWGSMSFFELATSGWEHTGSYAATVIELADWMIDVHCTMEMPGNTAYAYEGIIHAYELARRKGDIEHTEKFACVIDTGLLKLTSWQVGSPVQNDFLKKHPTRNSYVTGGVLNHASQSRLRIDVTQHQMHAVLLARRYVYRD